MMLLLVSLALAGAVGACSGRPGSGVDRNKPLSDLNNDEKKKLCDSFARQVAEQLPLEDRCRVEGAAKGFAAVLQLGDIKKACQEATTKCLEATAAVVSCDKEALAEFPACKTTVGTLEDCGADYVNDLAAFTDKFPTCDNLKDFISKTTADELEELSMPPAAPASCDKLPDDCDFPPDLAG